jgi:hypothetical protein
VAHDAVIGQLSQAGANRGGAQAAEFAQLLHSDGLIWLRITAMNYKAEG